MAIHRLNDDDTLNLARCATCAVVAEAECRAGADANTICATCGMPAARSQSERDSYFSVIMRLGRPGPATWPRRNA
jgi:hypothetical protein